MYILIYIYMVPELNYNVIDDDENLVGMRMIKMLYEFSNIEKVLELNSCDGLFEAAVRVFNAYAASADMNNVCITWYGRLRKYDSEHLRASDFYIFDIKLEYATEIAYNKTRAIENAPKGQSGLSYSRTCRLGNR